MDEQTQTDAKAVLEDILKDVSAHVAACEEGSGLHGASTMLLVKIKKKIEEFHAPE